MVHRDNSQIGNVVCTPRELGNHYSKIQYSLYWGIWTVWILVIPNSHLHVTFPPGHTVKFIYQVLLLALYSLLVTYRLVCLCIAGGSSRWLEERLLGIVWGDPVNGGSVYLHLLRTHRSYWSYPWFPQQLGSTESERLSRTKNSCKFTS